MIGQHDQAQHYDRDDDGRRPQILLVRQVERQEAGRYHDRRLRHPTRLLLQLSRRRVSGDEHLTALSDQLPIYRPADFVPALQQNPPA
jgi:hypothetical protein